MRRTPCSSRVPAVTQAAVSAAWWRRSRALRRAGLDFVRDPMGAPQIPNWNRVTSALPRFLQDLREAVDADSR